MAKADERVGQIVQTLENEGLMDSTLLILTTGHGGIGKTMVEQLPLKRQFSGLLKVVQLKQEQNYQM